jgi:hypothetical protein
LVPGGYHGLGSKVSSIPPDFFHHQAIFTDESMI